MMFPRLPRQSISNALRIRCGKFCLNFTCSVKPQRQRHSKAASCREPHRCMCCNISCRVRFQLREVGQSTAVEVPLGNATRDVCRSSKLVCTVGLISLKTNYIECRRTNLRYRSASAGLARLIWHNHKIDSIFITIRHFQVYLEVIIKYF